MKDRIKTKKLKKEGGITLIALIITIIILVILAAVSIRAVTNMRIIGHAINGTQQYAEGAKAENEMYYETGKKIEDVIAKIKEIQKGESNLEQNDKNNDEDDKQDNDVPNSLKDIVLGQEIDSVRPGKDENDFLDDIELIADSLCIIGDMSNNYYYYKHKEDNVVYRITVNRNTKKTTDVAKIYKPKDGSMEGQIVYYKAKASDETAGKWIVLYDNGDTVDIASLNTTKWQFTIANENTPGETDLEKLQYAYENAWDLLNNYCKEIVTNIDASKGEKVRCIGTIFNQTDTENYVSFDRNDFQNGNNIDDSSSITVKADDIKCEQDVARMTYYCANLQMDDDYIEVWMASRQIEYEVDECEIEGVDEIRYDVRCWIPGNTAVDNMPLFETNGVNWESGSWLKYQTGSAIVLKSDYDDAVDWDQSAVALTKHVIPVVRVSKSSL